MSTFIGVGISDKKDPFLAACDAAKVALYQLHHRDITLAIVFSTIHFADKRMLEGIVYTLGDIRIIGGSGAALISSGGIVKYGVGIMLINCDKIKLSTACTDNVNQQNARDAGEEFAQQLLRNSPSAQRNLTLTFSDGLVEQGSELLRGIKDVLGLSFPVFGASTADNFRFYKTFQYFNTAVMSNSIVGALFSGERLFGMGLRHGWKPLGKPHTITQVKGNVIKKIEGRPAVGIYEEYFGKTREEIQKSLVRLSTYYPLGLYVPGEAEYLLRNSLRIDEDGGLVCQGDAAEGSEIRLMMGTKEWALAAATHAAEEAKAALDGSAVRGALLFESISRNKLLGRLTDQELSRIKEVLGNVPILGMCSYGEQAPLKSLEHYGESYVHNETLAVLAIGETHAHGKLA